MIALAIMAVSAAAFTAVLSRLLLAEPRVTELEIPDVISPLARRVALSPSSQPRQHGVRRSVALRLPHLHVPTLRLPRLPRWHVPKQAFRLHITWRWPQVRVPKLAFRLPARGRVISPPQPAAVVPAPEPAPAAAAPQIPAWLADLDVQEVPPVDRRVWLCWLHVSAYVGERREAFLTLVEESDPELISVARLARQTDRPLVIYTLEEAQRWSQQIGTQSSSSAA